MAVSKKSTKYKDKQIVHYLGNITLLFVAILVWILPIYTGNPLRQTLHNP